MNKFFKKKSNIAILSGILIGSVAVLFSLIKDYNICMGSDQYYYLGLADSLLKNGYLADISYFEIRTVVTPQNAIAVLMAILKYFGIGNYDILNTITITNYVFWVISVIPFIKLLNIAGIKNDATKSILILAYLAGKGTLFYQMIPINDGIYNAAIIFLTYIIYKNLFLSKNQNNKKTILQWGLISLLSIIVVHFSFRTLIFLVSFLIVSFLIKRANRFKSTVYLLGTTLLSIVSLILPYLFIDVSDMMNRSSSFLSNIWNNLHNVNIVIFNFLFHLNFYSASHNILGKLVLNFVLLCFVATLLYSLYYGWKKKNIVVLFSSILVILTTVAVLFLPSLQIFFDAAPRYMAASLPFFYIISVKNNWSKYFIFFIILISIAYTFLGISNYIKRENLQAASPISRVYFKYNKINLPEEAIFSSFKERDTYVWFGGRSKNDLCSIDIKNKNSLWIFGDNNFQESQKQMFLNCNEVEILDINHITPDHHTNKLIEYIFVTD